MGHLNGFFAPGGGNLNKPIFKSSNAQGWMLKLRFDWYIIVIKTKERTRALGRKEGTENIPDKMSHCCYLT